MATVSASGCSFHGIQHSMLSNITSKHCGDEKTLSVRIALQRQPNLGQNPVNETQLDSESIHSGILLSVGGNGLHCREAGGKGWFRLMYGHCVGVRMLVPRNSALHAVQHHLHHNVRTSTSSNRLQTANRGSVRRKHIHHGAST
jgi:hypothetical protein